MSLRRAEVEVSDRRECGGVGLASAFAGRPPDVIAASPADGGPKRKKTVY